MKLRRIHVLVAVLGLILGSVAFRAKIWSAAESFSPLKNRRSVSERVAEFGAGVHGRLAARFRELGIAYPPRRIALVGLKQERLLEVWVAGEAGEFRYLKDLPHSWREWHVRT